MCGFLVSKHTTQSDFTKIRLRGGDGVNCWETDDYMFKHSLLSITGEKTFQPYIDGDIVCVYNGEIYNQPFKVSDGEVIIPLYKEYGWTFPQKLDGEFSIGLYDFEKGIAVFATDTFGSKPMYVSGTEIASLRSGLPNCDRMLPNEIRLISLTSGDLVNKAQTHVFDFDNQHVDTYDKWCEAFEAAVVLRSKKRCFMGLSSGYDSGAISHCLKKHGTDFKAFSIVRGENMDIILKRYGRLGNVELIPEVDRGKLWETLQQTVDNEAYTFGSKVQRCVFDDNAIFGLAAICERGKSEERRVYISGQGSDEILSDYSPFPLQSELKGQFPEALYEWKNFRLGCQQSYITKEEHVAGAYGIESRYPFLDKHLVQQFLWLDTKLKNAHYKAPLRHYLITEGVPFEENVKRGFSPI